MNSSTNYERTNRTQSEMEADQISPLQGQLARLEKEEEEELLVPTAAYDAAPRSIDMVQKNLAQKLPSRQLG